MRRQSQCWRLVSVPGIRRMAEGRQRAPNGHRSATDRATHSRTMSTRSGASIDATASSSATFCDLKVRTRASRRRGSSGIHSGRQRRSLMRNSHQCAHNPQQEIPRVRRRGSHLGGCWQRCDGRTASWFDPVQLVPHLCQHITYQHITMTCIRVDDVLHTATLPSQRRVGFPEPNQL